MAKKYDVIPNIRRAKVTEKVGEVTLELSGTRVNLEKARKYLELTLTKTLLPKLRKGVFISG